MTKIDVTRTELVWPGKYNEDGTPKETPRVRIPFQIIETVNESRATRESAKLDQQPSLFDIYEGTEGPTFEEGWKNKLIWGDNLLVMGSLLEKFEGKIDLIYIDPPFATGDDFSLNIDVGDTEETVLKEPSIIEEKAYRDTWGSGIDSYLSMLYPRLALMRDLLAPFGLLCVHTDPRVNHYVQDLLVEFFGPELFVNEVIWKYGLGNARAQRHFLKKHDNISVFAASNQYHFNVVRGEITAAQTAKYAHQDENGYYMMSYGKKYYLKGGKPLEDVWDIPSLAATDSERLDYPTQKPESLLTPIVEALSPPGGLVADFFCGSGTTAAAAETLGRRWIMCDLGRFAVHTTRKRILEIPGAHPFDVLNLGKYERQYWQGSTFGDGHVTERTVYEYLAFVLRLYGAEPVPGLQFLHGRRGNALVHIGAVDAPITIDEVNTAVAECVALKQKELHVLGWEWEMGLNDLVVNRAKTRGVDLHLLQIPSEVMEQQAVDKGDIRFFELAYLDVAVRTGPKCTATVTLTDFVIPNTDIIPGDVQEKVKKWSDFIDYWAVDWNFQNDTFMQGFVTYRTRKDRSLVLTSDPHSYDHPGTYTVLVKAVDIFGNDTTQAYEVEVH